MSKFHITGSMLSNGAPPLAGILLYPSGNLHTMTADLTDKTRSEEEEKECLEAINILAFLLYALQRTDWIFEFDDHERKLALEFQEEVKILERVHRRSHLKLIKGGKDLENLVRKKGEKL
jgi:hypothetical protein